MHTSSICIVLLLMVCACTLCARWFCALIFFSSEFVVKSVMPLKTVVLIWNLCCDIFYLPDRTCFEDVPLVKFMFPCSSLHARWQLLWAICVSFLSFITVLSHQDVSHGTLGCFSRGKPTATELCYSTNGVVSKGLLTFPGFFMRCRVQSLHGTFRIYIWALIHLACLQVFSVRPWVIVYPLYRMR